MFANASAAFPPSSNDVPREPFSYWNEDTSTIKRIGIVVAEVLIGVAATAFFLYNPPLFFPLMFAGILFHDPLDKAFNCIYNIATMNYVTMTAAIVIIAVASILAFPTSPWVIGGLFALWCGKRLADIGIAEQIRRDAAAASAARNAPHPSPY